MLDKLKAIYNRYMEVEKLISSPDAMTDRKLQVQLNREYKDLNPIIKAYKEYKHIMSNIYSSKEIADDIISISESYNVTAKIIGRVEESTIKKLTIRSEFGEFEYN